VTKANRPHCSSRRRAKARMQKQHQQELYVGTNQTFESQTGNSSGRKNNVEPVHPDPHTYFPLAQLARDLFTLGYRAKANEEAEQIANFFVSVEQLHRRPTSSSQTTADKTATRSTTFRSLFQTLKLCEQLEILHYLSTT
ncbi:unnamed protein product, partial [Amoebophrya sp. A120]